jgi:predicted AAA+ superfamily ATPase
MIRRRLAARLSKALGGHPVVGLVGPRQVGKTTLALEIANERPAVYLDLESAADRAKLADPEGYLGRLEDRLVVLDEIHRTPDLFPVLRSLVDRGRRRGVRAGRFLVLGSASLDLLRQSSESLAGRILYLELGPLDVLEVGAESTERLFVRGGFPDSVLAADDAGSFEWREAFLRTYLERDVPQFGPRIPAETMRRFWTMLAHLQGSTANHARIAASLGVSSPTVARYVDLFVDLLLVRRLAPWSSNVGKRLVKSPKIYVRDSGLLHALLGLRDLDAILGHPIVGPSHEGFVIETLIGAAPIGTAASYYRTARGAEIDLVLEIQGGRRLAIEIKRGIAPRVSRGFHEACEDIVATSRFVVYSGTERFVAENGVEVLPLFDLARELAAMGGE